MKTYNMKQTKIVLQNLMGSLFVILVLTQTSFALDIFGRATNEAGTGTKRGLILLYQFNNPTGEPTIVRDVSGYGTPVDLSIPVLSSGKTSATKKSLPIFDSVTNSTRNLNYLDVEIDTLVRSTQSADKVINALKGSNEITIEAWLQNDRDDDPRINSLLTPIKIFTVGSILNLASNNSVFFLGTNYDMAAEFTTSVRNGNRQVQNSQIPGYQNESNHSTLRSADTADNKILYKDQVQHIVFTRSQLGELRLYVSAPIDLADTGRLTNAPVRIVEEISPTVGRFADWGNEPMYVGIGNELTYMKRDAPIVSPTGVTSERRPWRGSIFLLAVYNAAHTVEEVQGKAAPGQKFLSYKPDPTMTITAAHEKAALIYNRLVGVKIPVSAPIIRGPATDIPAPIVSSRSMVDFINQGDDFSAALLATQEDNFLNTTVKDFAKKMSTRDEVATAPLSDFAATVIGVTRDNINAQQLMTGNFFYKGDPTKAAVPNDMRRDLLMSNSHYAELERRDYNLSRVLVKVDGQQILANTSVRDHPDPAGILTSRGFMSAHAVAGTNRRLIEFTFREFMCVPMSGWADSTGPDNFVGRDVDRFPGGDHNKFLNTCRGCHSNMDGLRGTFSKFNFQDGYVKYGPYMPAVTDPDDEDATNMCHQGGIACKYARNPDTFPTGKTTLDDSWINNANRGSNVEYFKWGSKMSGSGIRQFGEMIAGAGAYPKCLAKRVFRSVCKREPAVSDDSMLNLAAKEFADQGFVLRRLFARIVVSKECLGK